MFVVWITKTFDNVGYVFKPGVKIYMYHTHILDTLNKKYWDQFHQKTLKKNPLYYLGAILKFLNLKKQSIAPYSDFNLPRPLAGVELSGRSGCSRVCVSFVCDI